MATAVSTKPMAHPGKIKRPPPPTFVQSGASGSRPAQTSPSSGSASANWTGSFKQFGNFSASGTAVNGASGRLVARVNGDPSQRTQDPSSRLQRPSTRRHAMGNGSADGRHTKKLVEPYVKTTSYILKKFAKFPPSLTMHLHPTHFRFDKQDGSFPYNSEMKVVIEHLKDGTVPHDMMEELIMGNVRFYDGCLIVQVIDHRSPSAEPTPVTKASTGQKLTPFSIHNYNEHMTPSSYVPYPKQNQATASSQPITGDQPPQAAKSPDSTEAPDTNKSKGKQPPAGEVTNAVTTGPKVFTTVLHPTPRSLQAELTLLSTIPDTRAQQRRQSQGFSTSRTSTSTSLTQPSTPLSAVAPPLERGHPAKRQKMLVEPYELPEVESKLILATAPPLYLDPVDSLEASQNLLKLLESPLHCHKPPSPKTRRRTVAELAADEALAAAEERFMLIMDERLEPAISGAANAAKSAVADGDGGAVPFEP
ncbi:conserved hypothetical protein, partial [Microsporum canis CBS 113480]